MSPLPDIDGWPALGAHPVAGGTRFAVFCTTTSNVGVRLYDEQGSVQATHPLAGRPDGLFQSDVAGVGHGARYKFVLEGKELPDPYARFLPDGVHAPAMVVEPRYRFRHEAVSRPLGEQVIYELHVGTFSPAGTYEGARERLRELVDLGITTIELMPVAAFAGRRGWGYDGVAMFAPFAPYGTPDDLRALVDEAHGLGLSVLLDVVYNHFGPAGNYLSAYSPEYFSHDIRNAWGDPPNYAHPVMRRFALDNALYWLREFRFDGLRLDAIHAIVDPSPRHLLRDIADQVAQLSPRRLLIGEDDRNDPAAVLQLGLDGVWADDFHHQLRVTLTGERDGYYGAYQPGAAGLADAINGGWLYQGEIYPTSGKPRGKPADTLPAPAFVYCIQNHDQVGNRAFGERLSNDVPLDAYATASMVLLFLPMTPLLFMGQEWAASTPFLFFTDHDTDLGALVSKGRRDEFKAFKAFSDPAVRARIPDPQAAETFERSKLRWDERGGQQHERVLTLYRELLRLRRNDPVLRQSGREGLLAQAEGSLLVVRRRCPAGERLLLANLASQSATVPAECGDRPLLLTSGVGGKAGPAAQIPGLTAWWLGDIRR